MPERGSFYTPEKQPVAKDEEEQLERGITHDFYEPTEDSHLEDDYDARQGEGFDIDDGHWDDDPSPYGGIYSEE